MSRGKEKEACDERGNIETRERVFFLEHVRRGMSSDGCASEGGEADCGTNGVKGRRSEIRGRSERSMKGVDKKEVGQAERDG